MTGLDGNPLVFNQKSPLRPGMIASNARAACGLMMTSSKRYGGDDQAEAAVGVRSRASSSRSPSPRRPGRCSKNAIDEFNYETTGFRDGRYLAAFVRDDDGGMIAGISGFTWGGYCKVEIPVDRGAHRRGGLGRRLLTAAEDEARLARLRRSSCSTRTTSRRGVLREAPGTKRAVGVDDTPRGSGQTWFRSRSSERRRCASGAAPTPRCAMRTHTGKPQDGPFAPPSLDTHNLGRYLRDVATSAPHERAAHEENLG